jgi:hypothetical protein
LSFSQNEDTHAIGTIQTITRERPYEKILVSGPSCNAVVVCTAWNDGGHEIEKVLWEYVIKALDESRRAKS